MYALTFIYEGVDDCLPLRRQSQYRKIGINLSPKWNCVAEIAEKLDEEKPKNLTKVGSVNYEVCEKYDGEVMLRP